MTAIKHGEDAAATTSEQTLQQQQQPAPPPPQQPPAIFIQGLTILSPRQKTPKTTTKATKATSSSTYNNKDVAVPLPPLRPEEPVASLRGALSEVLGFAHLTRYRLVVERLNEKTKSGSVSVSGVSGGVSVSNSSNKQKQQQQQGGSNNGSNNKKSQDGNNNNNCWSPFTLRDAQVTISPSLQSLEAGGGDLPPPKDDDNNKQGEEELVLDEYGDLSILLPLLENNNQEQQQAAAEKNNNNNKIVLDASHIAIRVVLEKYDLASIRDHMMRVRQLLEGNAPYVTSLLGDDAAAAAAVVEEEGGEVGVAVAAAVEDKQQKQQEEVDDKKKEKDGASVVKEEEENADSENGAKNDKNDTTTKEEKKQQEEEEKQQDEQAKQAAKDAIAATLPCYTSSEYDTLFESSTSGGDFTNFYYLACGEEDMLLHTNTNDGVNGSSSGENGWMLEGGEQKENKKKSNSGGRKNKKTKNNDKSSSSPTSTTAIINSVNGEHSNETAPASSSAAAAAAADKTKSMFQIERTLYNLNEATHISNITLRLSGYHPPPAHRRVLGDLAYLEASLPDNSGVVHITAFPLGFYVNRSTSSKFDPTPNLTNNNSNNGTAAAGKDACYSHALLDCLLQRSKSLRASWTNALRASKQRSDLLNEMATKDGNSLFGIFRPVASPFPNNCSGSAVAAAGGGGIGMGFMSTTPTTFTPRIDYTTVRPTWLVPLPSKKLQLGNDNGGGGGGAKLSTWEHDKLHSYNMGRAEEELTNVFGMDVRGGGLRDWNEELQTAREMPVETFGERIERARLVHKVLSDFGDAALHGVKAIFDGYIMSMNPNEPARSHVYLHNNIFFSRAVDAGLDTFKIIQGDDAAKKSASRDAHNLGVLHRLDIPGLHTLATVLVEYLGTRIVCQSVVPGILHGEKSHSLLYGAVETLSALECNEEMHKLLESSIGEGCMVATRKIPAHPLTDERMDTIKKYRITPFPEEINDDAEKKDNGDDDGDEKDKKSIQVCGPMEMKGILGSDKRKYVLDCTRLTPRDANWVSKDSGGTGRWEDNDATSARSHKFIPSTLEDDEWTACVLRPELVTNYAEMKISKYLKETAVAAGKKDDVSGKEDDEDSLPGLEDATTPTSKDAESSASADAKKTIEEPSDETSEEKEWVSVPKTKGLVDSKNEKEHLAKVEEEYIRSLRYNVNVFLPFTRSIEIIDNEAHEQMKQDEEEARELARHLWDTAIPTLTKDIRSSSGNGLQLPAEGRSLTELIHSRGVNCRYLGRLAELARKEELEDIIAAEKAASASADTAIDKTPAKKAPRFRMPICWLELLECEMVARAAKHVLDSYMTEQGGASAVSQPAQTIASFLSAVVSIGEESAAGTEMRTESSQQDVLDQEDMNALTLFATGDSGDTVSSSTRGRDEIWSDIEQEIGRRYRCTLSLYNTTSGSSKKDGKESRALYTPLLRRICQRSGIRLVAKHYAVGQKCVCGGGSGASGLTASYPIAPTDILDILPLVKHAASVSGESFAPCSFNGNAGAPSLHVLLSDAKTVYEFGHANLNSGNSAVALDYANEASVMYQRVMESLVHPQISKCFKLIAVAHYHKDEPELALAAATKYLAVSISLHGFDSTEVLNAHMTMADILLGTGKILEGVKHLRAAQFLMEFMAGKNYAGISSTYYRMGSHYYDVGKLEDALSLYQVASARRSEDRMFDCLIARNSAGVLARLGQFKPAFDFEKKAYQLYVTFLGEDHDATKACSSTLIQLMKLAVEQEKRSKIQEKERVKENAADAIADEIRADEEAEETKPKKKKRQSKKKSKK
ncbi:hypothetical protein ACHAXR_012903 [Thalassiosira sp. AJA248-18]